MLLYLSKKLQYTKMILRNMSAALLIPATLRIFLIIQLTTITYCNGDEAQTVNDITTSKTVGEQQLSEQFASTVIQGLTVALDVTPIKATVDTDAAEVTLTASNPNVKTTLTSAVIATSRISANTAFLTPNQNIMKFINRDNILKRHNINTHDDGILHAANDATFTSTSSTHKFRSSSNNSSTCPSCQLRKKAKLENLESIKMHILMRLQLTTLPNITSPIPVPKNILKNFYKTYNPAGSRKQPLSHITTKSTSTTNSDLSRASKLYYIHQSTKVEAMPHYEAHSQSDYIDSSDTKHEIAKDINIQSDDPYAYQNYAVHSKSGDIIADFDDFENNYDDDMDYLEDVEERSAANEFYSTQHSVYVFPTMPRIRHNRKSEVLNFKFDNNYATISRVVMHIYLRGRDWMREHDATLLEHRNNDGTIEKRREILITVHRAVRCNISLNYTHTVKLKDSRHKIPSGYGQWVQIELKQLSTYWMRQQNTTQGIVIKSLKPWMRPFIVIDDSGSGQDEPYTVHIELMTKDKRRRKRSTSLDCQESDHEVRCCRYPLKVNFTNFGWHFVVAPTSFDAYFCNGECKVGYLEQYTHTHLASLTTSATPCCSPTKMSPLSLLYFNSDQNLVLSTIPNMSVEKCSCS